jgi:hypothetical protein
MGLKLQGPAAHIKPQRIPEIQPQPRLKSRLASGRPVCYLILQNKLYEAGRPKSTFDPKLSRG